jgi:hypothetical protein
LSLMLKRSIEVIVGATLMVAMLAVVLPAVAQAQTMTATQDGRGTNRDAAADAASAAARAVVVRPGDSLWSISEERLGPKATPQQIASWAERIYALNRTRIGADPDLIFPGQKLLVPPVAEPTHARNAAEPPQKNPRARATKRSAPDPAPRSTVGEVDLPKAGEAPDAVGGRAHLPDMARPAPVPAARPLAPSDTSRPPSESLIGKARAAVSAVGGVLPREGYTGRRLIGVALLVGSGVLALVLARYAARELGVRGLAERRAREARAKNYYFYAAAFGPHLFDDGEKRRKTGEEGMPTADPGSGAAATDIYASARRRARRLRRPARPQGPAGRVRKVVATGAQSPHLRRALRRRRRSRQ